ncbi:MAG: hypothetical protein QG656_1705, partial [Candidatus Hydrogenedentes bacterium]|nr:hypothetical protein [Candidatus Hydrogenedentota bacterium]
VLALLASTLFHPSERLMGYGLAGLTFLSLCAAFGPGIGFTERPLVFPDTGFVESVRRMEARLCGSDALQTWPMAGNLIPQVYCSSGAELKRHADFMRMSKEDPMLLRRTGSPALLLAKQDIQGPFATVRSRLNVGHVFPSGAVLFNDLGMEPRARMIYEGRRIDAYDSSLLSSELPPLLEGGVAPRTVPVKPARAEIADNGSFDRVEVHVELTPPGILVLADAWYPGWKALVDGNPAPVFPVDGMFRGVEVGEGEHRVEFYYDPDSFKIGRWVSLTAAGVAALGIVYAFLARLRNYRRFRRF